MGTNCSDNLIDLSARPFIPDDMLIARHTFSDKSLEWDAKKVSLYLDEGQQGDGLIEGYELDIRLADKPVLDANVLDHLLKHTEQIPEDWKRNSNGEPTYIYFWGTLYNLDDKLFVRRLFWNGDGKWCHINRWLANDWYMNDPTAIFKT